MRGPFKKTKPRKILFLATHNKLITCDIQNVVGLKSLTFVNVRILFTFTLIYLTDMKCFIPLNYKTNNVKFDIHPIYIN